MSGIAIWHIALDLSPSLLALMIVRSAIKLTKYAHGYRPFLTTSNEHLHSNQHIAIGILAIVAGIPFSIFQVLHFWADMKIVLEPSQLLFESLSVFTLDLLLLCVYWFFEHMKDEEGGWFGYARHRHHVPGFDPNAKSKKKCGWGIFPDPLRAYLRMFL